MKKMNLCLNEFKAYIQDKKCICFGTGLQGLRFINIIENWRMDEKILAFLDNDPNKWGKTMNYENLCYPIIQIKEVFKFIEHDVVFVITCADFINISLQLEQYIEFKNVPYFSLIELGQKELQISDYESVIREYINPVIPKIIHYCWFGDKMPSLLKENIKKWRKLCPDYEIIEWNELNYDVCKNLYTSQAYSMKKWGYVPDYIRLDLIYQYGGIYLDTDIELIKRPNELLYQDGFISFDSSLLVNLGAGFGAKPKNNVIKALRDYYDNVVFSYPDGSFNKLSCMTHSYNVLKKYGIMLNDSLQKIGDINIYPMILSGTCTYTQQMRITEKTFFLHYGTRTWLDKKNNRIIDKVGENFKSENDSNLKSYSFR